MKSLLARFLVVFAVLFAGAPALADPAVSALNNLSNVPADAFAAKAFQVGTTARTLADRFSDQVNVRDYGAKGNGVDDDCGAFTLALATGRPVYAPDGNYRLVSCYLAMLTSGQCLIGQSRNGTILQFIYPSGPAGPAITVGGSTTRVEDTCIRTLWLKASRGQYAIWTRFNRGLRIYDVRGTADGWARLGDETLGTGKPSYVFEMYGGTEVDQYGSPTAGFDFINLYNFSGQYFAQDAMLAGACNVPCPSDQPTDGFNTEHNIQQRVDHGVITGGYLSRFRTNYRIVNGRVVNFYMTNHHSEIAWDHAFVIGVTSDLSGKAIGYVGAEGVNISNSSFDSVNEPIWFYSSAPSSANPLQRIYMSNIRFTGANQVKTAVLIEQSGAQADVGEINIDGLYGYVTPADANQDAVRIVGDSTFFRLHQIIVTNVNLTARTTPFRSMVRVEGSGARLIDISNINGFNAGKLVDDQTGVLGAVRRNGCWRFSQSHDFGTVANGASQTWGINMSSGAIGAKIGDAVAVQLDTTATVGVAYTGRENGNGFVTITETNNSGSSQALGSLPFVVSVCPMS